MIPESLQFPDMGKVFPGAEEKRLSIPRPATDGSRTAILIADDDPLSRLTLFQSLAAAGYEVVVAENGPEAIAALRKPECPPVAILSQNLPGLNGLEICARMREIGKAVHLILSSDGDALHDQIAGLAAGADAYLPKPAVNELLLALVKTGLRAISHQRALEEELDALSPRSRRDR